MSRFGQAENKRWSSKNEAENDLQAQIAIDCHSRYAWARFSTSKLPVGAVHFLNNDILPFYERRNSKPEVVLFDNGGECCGKPDRHPSELFLQIEEIEHRKTKDKRPQSNGFLERFHRTLLDEHSFVGFHPCLGDRTMKLGATLPPGGGFWQLKEEAF